MTAEHAKHWMDLMRQVLDKHVKKTYVREAIDEFLDCSMRKYAADFQFSHKDAMHVSEVKEIRLEEEEKDGFESADEGEGG